MKRLLSGMRPTGAMHLGHFFGVLRNWAKLQNKYQSFFMIADWHALTDRQTYENLNQIISEIVLLWLAAGIDPKKSVIFRQSEIQAHAELETLFSLIAKMGDLKRIPSFKDAEKKIQNKVGFFLYPLLQAADILAYQADVVPVGEDQVPHVEYARVLAKEINRLAKKEILPLPLPLLTKAKRVPGVDGKTKMSKSLNNVIELKDTSQEKLWPILSKVPTDPARVTKNDPGDPKKCPIIFPYAELVMSKEEIKEIIDNCKNAKWGCLDCKEKVTQKLADTLEPLRENYARLKEKKDLVWEILEEGRKKAKIEAEKTLKLMRPIFGL